jgi:hypothetical protein
MRYCNGLIAVEVSKILAGAMKSDNNIVHTDHDGLGGSRVVFQGDLKTS